MRVGVGVTLAFAAFVAPGRARACEPAIPTPHMIDPAQVGVDTTPPQLAPPHVTEIHHNDVGGGCQPKCGADYGATITNTVTDDMTPVNKIGYRLTAAAGTAPSVSLWNDGDTILGGFDGTFYLHWDSGDEFDFTIQVVAVDAAGNQSAPQTVRIQSDSGGCHVGAKPRGAAATLLVALALSVAAARRRD